MDEFLNGMVYLSADLRAIHVVQVLFSRHAQISGLFCLF